MKALSIFWVVVALLSPLLWAAPEYPITGQIQVSNILNVRSEAKLGAKVLGQLHNGDEVVITGEENGFYRLQYPSQLGAWTSSRFVLPLRSDPSQGQVAGDKVNVRSGPDAKNPVITQLDRREIVAIVGQEGEWTRIAPPAGVSAWVSSKYVLAGEPLAVIKKNEGRRQQAEQSFSTAVAAIKQAIERRTISEQEYSSLAAQLDEVVRLLPLSNESESALKWKTKLLEFRGLIRAEEIKALEQTKYEKTLEELKAEEQKKLAEIEKNAQKDEAIKKNYMFVGWLAPTSGLLNHPATHVLTDSGKTLYYIRANAANNLEALEGKLVGINGRVEKFQIFKKIILADEVGVIHDNPESSWRRN